MRFLPLLAAVLASTAVLIGEAQAGADDEAYLFPTLESQLDRMSSPERKAARCQAIDVAIKHAVDDTRDASGRTGGDAENDPWITPREAGPRQVLNVYGRMRASSDKTTAHRKFQSRDEEALATAKVVSCLLYLLGEDRYPGIRAEAARGLGIFGVEEVGQRKAAEINQRLARMAHDDPSPIARLAATTTLTWLDQSAGADPRIYEPLMRIALDESTQGWGLANTATLRSQHQRRRLGADDWLARTKRECRARALELLIPAVPELSDSELSRLRKTALALRSAGSPPGHDTPMAHVVTQRLDRFVGALDQASREEWYTGARRSRGSRHGVAGLDASLR